jgi:hypothetical protein
MAELLKVELNAIEQVAQVETMDLAREVEQLEQLRYGKFALGFSAALLALAGIATGGPVGLCAGVLGFLSGVSGAWYTGEEAREALPELEWKMKASAFLEVVTIAQMQELCDLLGAVTFEGALGRALKAMEDLDGEWAISLMMGGKRRYFRIATGFAHRLKQESRGHAREIDAILGVSEPVSESPSAVDPAQPIAPSLPLVSESLPAENQPDPIAFEPMVDPRGSEIPDRVTEEWGLRAIDQSESSPVGNSDRGQPTPEPICPPMESSPVAIGRGPSERKLVEAVNLVELMVEMPASYAVISSTGGGKGFLLSHVWRGWQKRGYKIFVIDPKNDPKERGYWVGTADNGGQSVDFLFRGQSYDRDLSFKRMSVPEKTEWITCAIQTYKDWVGEIDEAPHMLIVDEATSLFSFAKNNNLLHAELRAIVEDNANQGSSFDHHSLIAGHTPVLTDYGLSSTIWQNMRGVFLAGGQTAEATLGRIAKCVFFGSPLDKEYVKGLYKQSACGRAFYWAWTDRWYPMARLDNLCGYDRDTRANLTPVVPTEPVIPDLIAPVAVTAAETPTNPPELAIDVPESVGTAIVAKELPTGETDDSISESNHVAYGGGLELSPQQIQLYLLIVDQAITQTRRHGPLRASQIKQNTRMLKDKHETSEIEKYLQLACKHQLLQSDDGCYSVAGLERSEGLMDNESVDQKVGEN